MRLSPRVKARRGVGPMCSLPLRIAPFRNWLSTAWGLRHGSTMRVADVPETTPLKGHLDVSTVDLVM